MNCIALFLILCFLFLGIIKQSGSDTTATQVSDSDICTEVIKSNSGMHPLCSNMAPRNGNYQASTSPSPWQIYTWKSEIRQHFTHPIVMGSSNKNLKIVNYIITAKAVAGGHMVGHFEYQWDALPICCYVPGQKYEYQGLRLHPVRNPQPFAFILIVC